MATRTITTSVEGLGAEGMLLQYELNPLIVRAPDWDADKALQIWVAELDDEALYLPDSDAPGSVTPLEIKGNMRILVRGPIWFRPFLVNAGTGVSIISANPLARN